MTEKMYKELKTAVLKNGVDAIDNLLGYKHDVNESLDIIEEHITEVLNQIPEDIALEFFYKYCSVAETEECILP